MRIIRKAKVRARWLVVLSVWLVLPVMAAAPVEERAPGVVPMANQQQRAAFARGQVDQAEREVRLAREKVEELTRTIQAMEKELAARRAELDAAHRDEALAGKKLGEARKQVEKETVR